MQRSVAQSPIVAVTNHGPHSAETWSLLFVKTMLPIDPNIEEDRLPIAEGFQQRVAHGIEPLINKVIEAERLYLQANDARYSDPYDGHLFIDQAMANIYHVTSRSMWGDYIRQFDDFLRWGMTRHLNHVQHVERLWHADNNHSEAGRNYRAQHGE